MVSSRGFTRSSCSTVTAVVTGHSSRCSTPTRCTPPGDELQRGPFCWPPAGNYPAVIGQDLMATDTREHVAKGRVRHRNSGVNAASLACVKCFGERLQRRPEAEPGGTSRGPRPGLPTSQPTALRFELRATKCIVVVATFASVPRRSCGPQTAPATAHRPATLGGRAHHLTWAALLVQTCGGQATPGMLTNALRQQPSRNDRRHHSLGPRHRTTNPALSTARTQPGVARNATPSSPERSAICSHHSGPRPPPGAIL